MDGCEVVVALKSLEMNGKIVGDKIGACWLWEWIYDVSILSQSERKIYK